MSVPTLVPGWQATVTIDTEDFTAVGNVIALNRTKNVMTKPVFGSDSQRSLAGQKGGTFSASGHVSVEDYPALIAAYEKNEPVAFSIQIGTAEGSTDVGVLSGNCSIGSLGTNASADGEWEWSLEATIDGETTFTAPV